MDVLNIVAICMLFFIGIVGVYVVIFIHDIPYEIAKKRNHPHQDAIHVAGWVSLFLMHTIWPFLWIWAHLFKPHSPEVASIKGDNKSIANIKQEVQDLKCELELLKGRIVETRDKNE